MQEQDINGLTVDSYMIGSVFQLYAAAPVRIHLNFPWFCVLSCTRLQFPTRALQPANGSVSELCNIVQKLFSVRRRSQGRSIIFQNRLGEYSQYGATFCAES